MTQAVRPPRLRPAAPPAPRQGQRVYLVDDHAMFREGLRVLLAAAGHEVVGEASSSDLGLEGVRSLKPDVVLLDLGLAEGSGLAFLIELRNDPAPPPVVVLTMSPIPRHVSEAFQLGAAGYVLKGSPSREVIDAIQAVVRGQRFLGQGVEQALSAADAQRALSARERQIIDMVAHGYSSAAIGKKLHLSPKTIDTYRSRLMAKLGVRDLSALIRLVIEHKLVHPGVGDV